MEVAKELSNYKNNLEIERKIWNEYSTVGILSIPDKFPNCNKNITLTLKNSTINPYLGTCTNLACRKVIYISVNSIFELNSKTPLSLILYILEISIVHSKNANQIFEY